MGEQRNISTKKVIRFSVGALLVGIFMVALVAASNRQDSKTIRGLEVKLNDAQEYSFLQKKDVEQLLLRSRSISLTQATLATIDLRQMEAAAMTNPWVEKADIFIDNRQVLQVNITQRTPVARIFTVNGASYYMDSSLHTMPVSPGFAFAAPVFTNVPVLRNDSMSRALNRKLVYMSETISRDSFWRAQITQVEVQPDQSFVLITLLGNQRILAGDTARMPEKLSNLLAFYRNISNKIGWDKYETLDIRYKGQVVASPSIGWTPPRTPDTTSVFNGAAVAASTAAPANPAVAKPDIRQAAVTRPSAALTSASRKPAPPKQKPTELREKPRSAAQALARQPKPARQDKQSKQDQKKTKDTKTQSPKYIYPGKHAGNH